MIRLDWKHALLLVLFSGIVACQKGGGPGVATERVREPSPEVKYAPQLKAQSEPPVRQYQGIGSR